MRDVIEMMAQRGLGRGEVAEALAEAGWTAAQAERELGSWAALIDHFWGTDPR